MRDVLIPNLKFESALDVYLQLNFLIESGSCNSSIVQPLLQQLRAPKAPVRGVALCGSPLIPAVPLRLSPSPITPSILPSQGTCQAPWWHTVPLWLKRVREGT